jgi:hypothetical protein
MNNNNLTAISIKASQSTKNKVNAIFIHYDTFTTNKNLKIDANTSAELIKTLIDIGHGIISLGNFVPENNVEYKTPWEPTYAVLVGPEVIEKLAAEALEMETSIEAYAGICLRRAVDTLTAWHDNEVSPSSNTTKSYAKLVDVDTAKPFDPDAFAEKNDTAPVFVKELDKFVDAEELIRMHRNVSAKNTTDVAIMLEEQADKQAKLAGL